MEPMLWQKHIPAAEVLFGGYPLVYQVGLPVLLFAWLLQDL